MIEYPLAAQQMTFVVTLLALIVGHQLGDHVMQTDHQAANKAGRGRAAITAMLGHLTAYHATIGIVLFVTAWALHLQLTWLGVTAGFLFSIVTHAILDRRAVVRLVLQHTGSRQFADQTTPVCGMYVADQSLHWACLLVSALLMARL
ncbi:DUF3307 domain-containing protein [Catenuloplanes atrovinosus]|uniref:DUF3307 domain-containing protein n=1 Tax=Catenuloplanes atrovinosus TaxID=137266 RepID=A0AAE3YKF3_9ACTN|nr:DUF3307 domain-containing protein [Catenuloplanes atrovinosus]MDR7273931.1 hypothetical protein [Catenuloplanes atrovinosus]